MGSPRWAHQLGLYPKVLVMKETSQKLFNTIQPRQYFREHHGTARPRQVASGDRGGPVGAGADPQGTRGSILISISAP